jgi:hypothetical protein
MKIKNIKILLYVISLAFIFAPTAQAYVDPGTGSYIFQMVIAGVLSGLFFMKKIVLSIKLFFKEKIFRAKKAEDKNPDKKDG